MASSKVMATTSPTTSDLPRQPSLCPSLSTLLADLQNQNNINTTNGNHLGDPSQSLMDDLLRNVYSSSGPGAENMHAPYDGAPISREEREIGDRTVDEMWKEIVRGGDQVRGGDGGGAEPEMTLEDFLTKTGAVREEDVRGGESSDQVGPGGGLVVGSGGGYGVDAVGISEQYQMVESTAGGRGKRRAVEEQPLDKATQQKQRRMIKNRESAARSRERKQAYTIELESLVTQLEKENERLLREEVEQNKERFKKLMENLIPVEEKQRPPRVLRRVQSWHW
ncbi:bZIP_1 domain-containing protein [Cephalotus follicularis]|uniref:BZIP_1 domain-containing protein n=1 Tax=Cephalotus follicularis TaxID=3775 RepID=A0A1Q3BHB8_CEPFO|nr:bZIP_1 domain-containing protein [Cephalotus follicularis]